MTIEEKLKALLVQNGMSNKGADTVIARLKEDEVGMTVRGRWSDSVEGYPVQLLAVLWVSTKRVALEWINENCPQVWYKPQFEG